MAYLTGRARVRMCLLQKEAALASLLPRGGWDDYDEGVSLSGFLCRIFPVRIRLYIYMCMT